MSNCALLEIGTEEIPGSYFPEPLFQLRRALEKLLEEIELAYESLEVMATPRRLAAVINGLAPFTAEKVREVRGPPTTAAYDKDGQPTQAAIGFARSQGVAVEELVRKEAERGEYVFAVFRDAGLPAREILPSIFQQAIHSLSFPKTMRWGYGRFRFVRPIRWLVAMLDDEELPFEFEGLRAGRLSRGHRTLAPGPVEVPHAAAYKEILGKRKVIVDQEERIKLIEAQCRHLASSVGGFPYGPDNLLEEVNFMLEQPTGFVGEIDREFLSLPMEVLTTIMRKQQWYFAVVDEAERPLPYFIAFRDGDDYNLEAIKKGHERVLRARLADGVFFYEEDSRRRLETRVPELEKVTFQQQLGTMFDKKERLKRLAPAIAEMLGDGEMGQALQKAAELSKADLVCHMVTELPELEGIMGGEYARLQGEPERVATAISEHYLPRSLEDRIPQTLEGQILSLADKLDTLCAYLGIGLMPTGSEDPYALRRFAQGIVSILIEGELDLSISDLVNRALQLLKETELLRRPMNETHQNAMLLLQQRMEYWLAEQRFARDVINASMGVDWEKPREVYFRASAIRKLRDREDFLALVTAATRATNILKTPEARETLKGYDAEPNPALFQEEAEKTLYKIVTEVEEKCCSLPLPFNYQQLLAELSPLVEPINRFFDEVMVMVEEDELRANRLALLRKAEAITSKFGDLSQLER